MERPYSSSELHDLEKDLHARYRLSNVFAVHTGCNHRYRTKKGGKKEHYAEYEPSLSSQTCSVCYKLKTTSEPPTINGISEFDGEKISKKFLREKEDFYRWLYNHEYA